MVGTIDELVIFGALTGEPRRPKCDYFHLVGFLSKTQLRVAGHNPSGGLNRAHKLDQYSGQVMTKVTCIAEDRHYTDKQATASLLCFVKVSQSGK